MTAWLQYSAAFTCALGMAVLCYRAAFYAVMTGAGYGIAGFILLAVIFPVLAGLIVFGVAYKALSRRNFSIKGWGQGIAFVAVVAATAFGLIAADLLRELLVTGMFVIVLYLGGLIFVMRAPNA